MKKLKARTTDKLSNALDLWKKFTEFFFKYIDIERSRAFGEDGIDFINNTMLENYSKELKDKVTKKIYKIINVYFDKIKIEETLSINDLAKQFVKLPFKYLAEAHTRKENNNNIKIILIKD